ncbi:NAD(P)-binding protein [Calocera viscosa TUFC12733]|uniref:NAD(P)-binding protein n=1 Tax=Calocera viscosa (strain TUFC12733) TaxID=1330018 RepID=A0A167I7J2_CALVF|nr:NAD(P)-binding protein [Calocera viscosa TUFC12733]
MTPAVYLVSGASRGIGLALVAQLAIRQNTIVFAGARNPSAAKDLLGLQLEHPDKVYIVKLTSADKAENEAAIAKVKEIAGRLDVVIANAGLSGIYSLATEVSLEAMRNLFEVNVLGPLVLFQASYALLKASTEHPKFFTITSELASVQFGPGLPWPTTAYGTSKAAANWLTLKLHYEYPGLIAFPIHPGVVKTDMTAHAEAFEPLFAAIPKITPEESAKGILNVVVTATRDEEGPKFMTWDGRVMPL